MEGLPLKRAKTEDTTSSEVKIKLQVLPEVPVIPCHQRNNFRFMASLKAPSIQLEKRAPLRIMAVIDVSSSMSGQKLELVKETLRFMISQLSSTDQLGIISYSSEVSVLCPLFNMDNLGKQFASEAVKMLIANGATNLCGGLTEGLRWMHEYAQSSTNSNNNNDNTNQPTRVNSLLLFTDGCANVHKKTQESIIDAMKKFDRQYRFTRVIPVSETAKWQLALHKSVDKIQVLIPAILKHVRTRSTIQLIAPQPTATGTPSVAPLAPTVPNVAAVSTNTPVAPPSQPVPSGGGKEQSVTPAPVPAAPTPVIAVSPNRPSVAPPSASIPLECIPVIPSAAPPPLPCTVHTFGFGTDHDANMLKAIAEEGSGVYYFIESAAKIPEAFADCLGGLLSVVGQKIVVEVRAAEGVQIKQVMTAFPVVHKGNTYEISIPDMQSDEQKDIPIVADIPQCEQPTNEFTVAYCSATYHNVVLTSDEGLEAVCVVKRDSTVTTAQPVNHSIQVQANRVLAAQAMQSAATLGGKGNLAEAREAIAQAVQQIHSGGNVEDSFTKNLLSDLENTNQLLQDQTTFQNVGTKTILANVTAHQQQRSTAQAMPSQQLYQTPARVMMQQAQQAMISQQLPPQHQQHAVFQQHQPPPQPPQQQK